MSTRVLFRHSECFVYRIPPESFSAAGHRAELWGLENPFITASIELSEEEVPGEDASGICTLKMYKGKKLFAKCEFDMELAGAKGLSFYIQQVTDSSRYWALRISDKTSGRTAFIGFGFRDRDTATELRSAVQDSLQFLDREREAKRLQALDNFGSDDDGGNNDGTGGSKEAAPSKLQLADGQTLKLSMAGVSPEKQHALNKKKKHHQESEAEAFAALALPPSSQTSSAANGKKCMEENVVVDAGGVSGSNDEEGDDDDDDDWGDFTAADASSSAPASGADDSGKAAVEAEEAPPSTGGEPAVGAALPVVARVNADAEAVSF